MPAQNRILTGASLRPGAFLEANGLPSPSAEALRHSGELADLLRSEIHAGGGWLPFSRFMELALYAPGMGYYAAGAAKFGSAGDFVTAPGISPLFGAVLARQVADILAQGGGQILELGAGEGTLATQVLLELENLDGPPVPYRILEPSPDLQARQRNTLGRHCPALAHRVEWIHALPEKISGVVLANEVLDALPVHRIAWREAGPVELGVGWREDRFFWTERPIASQELRERAMQMPMAPGYQSEISLAGPALVRTLGGALEYGALVFIDYGFGRREYYHPERTDGTLMCHFRHRAHDDVFLYPGLQDISAHVDFSTLADTGMTSGLDVLGFATQAQFLLNCGILDLLSRTSAEDAAAYLPLAAGMHKLLSPAEMGELFKVLALGKGLVPPLRGFRSGDKSRSL